jgi:hypothetical protein
MKFEDFQNSLSAPSPSLEISEHLKSLWYDAKGDWGKAHNVISEIEDENAAWIHAYLHRKEGDIGNSDYWYRLAGKKRPEYSLEREWGKIVKSLL